MSESTLTLGYPDFQAAVGYYLGFGRTVANWSTDQTNDVEACIQGGLRLFYNPNGIPGVPRHEWKFMRPIATLPVYGALTITAASWTNGVATVTVGVQIPVGSIVNIASVTPDGGTGGYNGTYTITANTSTTFSYALTSNPGAYVSGGTASCYDYQLSDDFGGIDGDMTFAPADNARYSIPVVSEEVIRIKRMTYITVTGRPMYVAIKPLPTDGTVGQRFMAQFWPNIDGNYTLSYRYRALLNKVSTTNPYPVGGMGHAETIQACMIAYAERFINDTLNGERWDYMVQRLIASANEERTGMVPEFYGYNADESDKREQSRFPRTVNVTYNGVSYP